MVEDLRTQFEADGVIAIRSAFSGEDAAFLRDMIWRHVEDTTGVRRADADTWTSGVNFGLRQVEMRNVWGGVHSSPRLTDALDAIFGPREWEPPGPPQILLTFPKPETWSWPSGWHVDFGWEVPTFPVGAVKLFALLDTVDEAGGGTLLLSGSHRLVEQLANRHGRRIDPWDRDVRPLRDFPQLSPVLDGNASRALLGESIDADGVVVRPIEITGQPGDIVIAHMQVFHAPAPNATGRPRQMIGNAVRRRTGPATAL